MYSCFMHVSVYCYSLKDNKNIFKAVKFYRDSFPPQWSKSSFSKGLTWADCQRQDLCGHSQPSGHSPARRARWVQITQRSPSGPVKTRERKPVSCPSSNPPRRCWPNLPWTEVQWRIQTKPPFSKIQRLFRGQNIYIWLPAPSITILHYKTLGYYLEKGKPLSIFI